MNDIRIHCIDELKLIIPDKTSLNIEKSIFNFCIQYATKKNIEKSWTSKLFEHIYKEKACNVLLFISNPSVQHKIQQKEILSKDIAFLVDIPQKETEEINEEEIQDGIFQCRKCGSKKTTYYSLQTRSADEPMTNFITCINCKNRWKM